MSSSWFIYAPRPQAELLQIADDLHELLALFLETHPDCDDELGEVGAGGRVPTVDELRAKNLSVDRNIFDRISRCRASLMVDPVPEAHLDSPLQVSALAWLLDVIGPCVVDWGEHELALSEKVLADLKKKQSRGSLDALEDEDADDDDLDDDEDAPERARKGGPGAARAEACATKLRAAIDDVERAIDLRRALQRTTDLVRNYAALLLEEGAMDDESAARLLGIAAPEVDRAAKTLTQMLEALEEED